MAKKRKKRRSRRYNPIREVGGITGTTSAVLLGGHITSSVAAQVPGGPAMVASPLRMMNVIPVAQAGGSVIRSLDMLNPPKRRRKKK